MLGNTYGETKIIHLDRASLADALLQRSDILATPTDAFVGCSKAAFRRYF
jgi:hypothetical protein